jgi:hypothetical protein
MAEPLDLSVHTVFAELIQRTLDADFEAQFPGPGSIVFRTVKDHRYAYWQPSKPAPDGTRVNHYIGPMVDPDVAARVDRFGSLKDAEKQRRSLVQMLKAASLPSPDSFSGRVLEALAKAGVFRLRGILVGTMAFQSYAGLLGYKLPSAELRTSDIDLAQFKSVSCAMEDRTDDLGVVLASVDGTFRSVPGLNDPTLTQAFVNDRGYRVEFLVPNLGGVGQEGRLIPLPALQGAAGVPLRFLDYLIHEPVRSVILHGAGIHVLVPQPQRYAVHKLILSTRRRLDPATMAKRRKDLMQAGGLAEIFAAGDPHALAIAFREALDRGPAWRKALQEGLGMLQPAHQKAFATCLAAEGLEVTASRQSSTGPTP